MAKLERMQRDYFGVTLYIAVRGDKEYACQLDNWTPKGKGYLGYVRAWPGYGHYSGTVALTTADLKRYLRLQKVEV